MVRASGGVVVSILGVLFFAGAPACGDDDGGGDGAGRPDAAGERFDGAPGSDAAESDAAPAGALTIECDAAWVPVGGATICYAYLDEEDVLADWSLGDDSLASLDLLDPFGA